jgi:hypothetical protein
VRPCARPLHIYRIPHNENAGGSVLASRDLGFLLTRCNRVVVREGERHLVLESETVIQWRALQVALATPYLPGLQRLLAVFPGLRPNSHGVMVPLRAQSPEEVLARCIAEGMQVAGSRIVYSAQGRLTGGEVASRPPRPAALDRAPPASSV